MMSRVTVAVGLLLCLCGGQTFGRTAEEWKTRVIYQILTDRFSHQGEAPATSCQNLRGWCGGTFQGIKERLDYIQLLGANAIWISPIVLNTEGGYHGYWAKDLYEIEPHFGSREDLQELIEACHQRDVWVMLDVVPNHMGYPPGCGWQECEEPAATNFTGLVPFDQAEHYHTLCDIQDYDNQTQVELCRLAHLPDLNQSDPDVVDTLLAWQKDLTQQFNFDGYRIDTQRHIALEFWPGYQEAAGAYCVGEVASPDVTYCARYQGPQGVDAILNFPLYWMMRDVFNEKTADLTNLKDNLDKQRSEFMDVSVLGVFVETHDHHRFLNLTSDMTLYRNALTYVVFAQGIPILYYGSEQAFHGGGDPDNRESLWPHYNTESPSFQFLKALLDFRKQILTEMTSSPQTEVLVESDTMGFTRANNQLLVVITTAGEGGDTLIRDVPLDVEDGTEYVNIRDASDTVVVAGGMVRVTLVGGEPEVYYSQNTGSSANFIKSRTAAFTLCVAIVRWILWVNTAINPSELTCGDVMTPPTPLLLLLAQAVFVTGSPAQLALMRMRMSTSLPTTTERGGWDENGGTFPGLDNYPACGRLANPQNKPYICNPDGVLSEQDSSQLDAQVASVLASAKCACPATSMRCACTNTGTWSPRGHYGIGIAVVNGIEGVSQPGMDRCAVLARNLIEKPTWFTQLECYQQNCRDALVVVLDAKYRGIYTVTQVNASKALPNSCLDEINQKISPLLSQGRWVNALDEMLKYYGNALKGGRCGTRTGLSAGQIVGIVIGVVLFVAAIVFVILLCIGFCRNWDFVVGTCFGVCIGCIMWQVQRCINALIISAVGALCAMCGCPDCACQCDPLDCVGDDGQGGGAGIDF